MNKTDEYILYCKTSFWQWIWYALDSLQDYIRTRRKVHLLRMASDLISATRQALNIVDQKLYLLDEDLTDRIRR